MTIIPLPVEEKLNVARSLKLPVYIGAPTGYGKTTILKKYYAKESVWRLSCKSGTVNLMKPVAAIEQKAAVWTSPCRIVLERDLSKCSPIFGGSAQARALRYLNYPSRPTCRP